MLHHTAARNVHVIGTEFHARKSKVNQPHMTIFVPVLQYFGVQLGKMGISNHVKAVPRAWTRTEGCIEAMAFAVRMGFDAESGRRVDEKHIIRSTRSRDPSDGDRRLLIGTSCSLHLVAVAKPRMDPISRSGGIFQLVFSCYFGRSSFPLLS